MGETKRIVGSVTLAQSLSGEITDPEKKSGSIGKAKIELVPEYEGAYSITPTEQAQVIDVKDMKMKDNIVVDAIPNNYGLITWNGITLTVS